MRYDDLRGRMPDLGDARPHWPTASVSRREHRAPRSTVSARTPAFPRVSAPYWRSATAQPPHVAAAGASGDGGAGPGPRDQPFGRSLGLSTPLPVTPTPTGEFLTSHEAMGGARMHRLRSVAERAWHHATAIPILLIVASAAATIATVADALPMVLIVAATTVVALCAVRYVQLQRRVLVQQHRELCELLAHLGRVEAEYRDGRARMHEINSTIAGIASATHLLRTLPPAKRAEFEMMVEAEIDRLMRLLDDHVNLEVEAVCVDHVVEQLLPCHRARGRQVRWEPTGLRVLGRRDDLAEALNVLLENAAGHGTPDDIRLSARSVGATVEISVSDRGSGVPEELRDHIFEWGGSRPDSPGEGIGLHVARSLVRALDGELHLDATTDAGARFVVTLPAVETAPEADADLAMAG